jgi:GNAT superfamily N-acetyltransferase
LLALSSDWTSSIKRWKLVRERQKNLHQMKRSERKQYGTHEHVNPASPFVSEAFQVRRAAAEDAKVIAWHRARMFEDMGDVSADAFEILRAKAETQLKQWIDRGKYVGWLATLSAKPEMIVGGAGVQLQPILPRPVDLQTIGEGRQGVIVNVFTEPQWRRRGVASLLIKEILTWSKREQIDRLVLHASDEGRSIYEKLRFVASNETRFMGDLNTPINQAR